MGVLRLGLDFLSCISNFSPGVFSGAKVLAAATCFADWAPVGLWHWHLSYPVCVSSLALGLLGCTYSFWMKLLFKSITASLGYDVPTIVIRFCLDLQRWESTYVRNHLKFLAQLLASGSCIRSAQRCLCNYLGKLLPWLISNSVITIFLYSDRKRRHFLGWHPDFGGWHPQRTRLLSAISPSALLCSSSFTV